MGQAKLDFSEFNSTRKSHAWCARCCPIFDCRETAENAIPGASLADVEGACACVHVKYIKLEMIITPVHNIMQVPATDLDLYYTTGTTKFNLSIKYVLSAMSFR